MNHFLYFIQPISNFLAQVLVNGLVFSAILFCWAFSFAPLKRRWSASRCGHSSQRQYRGLARSADRI